MSDDRDLVSDYQAGSESAARDLFDKYCERLMKLAKRRIGQRMASRFDPEDVIQSAFRTFFTRVKNDEFTFEQEDDLFKLLVRLTVRKTLRRIEHHNAAKRNPSLEAAQRTDDVEPFSLVAGQAMPPDMEVALIDEFQLLIGQLPELDRQVLELKVQGYTTVEIAEKLGSYERKIRRVLERIEKLSKGEEADAGE
jgi:RNA polymerase sigma factor (sigma-70 family)